jgi:hypothetical protein
MGALYLLFFKPDQKAFRILGWIYITSLGLFLAAQGRGYYMAGAYPMLLAFGASRMIPKALPSDVLKKEFWQSSKLFTKVMYVSLVICGLFFVMITQPIGQVTSPWWRFVSSVNSEIKEEIGWPELVKEVANIYSSLPEEEKSHTGIFARNYGEAGAINLYGPAYGLPTAISGMNTYWLKGYGNSPPQTLIIMGASISEIKDQFESCVLAGHTPNPYNITNEETRDHPEIYLCRNLIHPWPEIWRESQDFG